jgi:hypothetical protein
MSRLDIGDQETDLIKLAKAEREKLLQQIRESHKTIEHFRQIIAPMVSWPRPGKQ